MYDFNGASGTASASSAQHVKIFDEHDEAKRL